MCGIAGVVGFEGGVTPRDLADLESLRDAMIHRGPDGAGEWVSPDRVAAFAHRRLAIIDPGPDGAQPMVAPDASVVLCFNGEIYNYRDLRAELEADGVAFRGHSDTEVLLELYRRYGTASFGRLRGMFAAALWDARRHVLVLVRDPFGIKPLYYARERGRLLFASQARPLVRLLDDQSADPAAIVSFLSLGFVMEPHGWFKAVRPVPPGCILEIDGAGACVSHKYFSLHDQLGGNGAEGGMTLDRMVASSVVHHLVSDVPVAVLLSAGIDSGTLLAHASAMAGTPPDSLTLRFNEYQGRHEDESVLAAEVAARYGSRHHVHTVSSDEFAACRAQVLDRMDQPSTDGVNMFLACRAAAGQGYKVVLSGVGADELFGGYPSFSQVPRLSGLLRPLRHVPALGQAGRWMLSRFPGLSPKAAGLMEFGTSIAGAYFLRRGLFMPWELSGIIKPEIAEEGWRSLDLIGRLSRLVRPSVSAHGQVMALEMLVYLQNQLLRDADWAGMASGVEVRTPFVDREFLRNLAPLVRTSSPVGKAALAATAVPSLPRAILERRKTGFSVPLEEWQAGRRAWARSILDAFPGGREALVR